MSSTHSVGAFLTFLVSCSTVRGLLQPEIVEAPRDAVAVVGEDVLLKCVIENLPLGDNHVQWTKDGFAFGYNRDIPGYKYSIIGDVSLGEYNFLIEDAVIGDEAQYECQVLVNRKRAKATVSILVPPKGPLIENSEGDGSLNVLANSENSITCISVNGKPAGKLAWYKDGLKISQNVTHDETSHDGKLRNSSATLTVWPTPSDDGNVYECKMSIDERFQGTNGIQDLTSSVTVQLNVQKPPIAAVYLAKNEVVEGEDVFVKCDSYASDPPATSYKWFVNGGLLKSNNKKSLRLSRVNKTWNGAIIGCSAINEVGASEISQSTLSVLYGPVLQLAPKNIVTNFTAVVDMSCSWDSNPAAKITWYKRGRMNLILGEGEHLKIDVKDQSAAGTYVCVGDALGVSSKSVTARLDVLGPPIIDSPAVQKTAVGDGVMLNCSLKSTPGISHVIWTWTQNDVTTSLKDNESKMVGGKIKFKSVMQRDHYVASLLIEDAQEKDFTDYNCTVHNVYGSAIASVQLEEQPSVAPAMMVPILAGAIAGLLLLVGLLLLTIFCVRRKRQGKSTTFPPEQDMVQADGDECTKVSNRTDPILTKKLLSNEEDNQDPASPPSLSSQDVVRERLEEFHNSAHNDDGYHTEEANSWNRNETNHSPPSSPTHSGEQEYPHRESVTPTIHMGPSQREYEAASPYAPSEAASDATSNGYLRYNMQPQPYPQYPLQYTPNVVDVGLPPLARAASPLQMYCASSTEALPPNYYQHPSASPSVYRGPSQGYLPPPQRSRAGSTVPSIVSSHRSVTPSPYVLGRATPTSVFMDRGMYHVPITPQPQIHQSSSQSSLDQVSSSIAMSNVHDNLQINRLNSITSHASRSSEMLSKPMTARMATHV